MMNFRRSISFGALVHALRFAFTLCCGVLVSALLDAAMNRTGGAARLFLSLAAVLSAGLPLLFFIEKRLRRIRRAERQDWREHLCRAVLARRIAVDSLGELDVRLSNDADAVAAFYQDAIPSAIEGTGIALGSALLLCRAHFALGLLLLALSLLQLLPGIVYEKWAKAIYEQTDDAETHYDGWLIQGADGLAALKSFRRESWFLQKLDGISSGMVKAGMRAERTGTVETVISQLVNGLLGYGRYVLLGLFVLRGHLRVTDTPVLIVLSGSLFEAMNALLDVLQKRFEFDAAKAHLAGRETPPLSPLDSRDPAVLRAEHVVKRYGEKTVLDGMSLAVGRGERVLVTGPNGCGKSTLLRILLGLLPADAGEVRADVRRVSFALQEDAALPLTGLEMIEALRPAGTVDIEMLRAHLGRFQIARETLQKPLCEWSMGQRRKFFLAVAFAKESDLLVLDEPANHLDADALAVLCGMIESRDGAVLAVSHRAQMPVRWDRVAVLKGGTPT